MKLTVAVHLYFQTLFEPTGLALIPSVQINCALSIFLADIVEVSSDTPLEKSSTSITTGYPIMFPRGFVATDSTELDMGTTTGYGAGVGGSAG